MSANQQPLDRVQLLDYDRLSDDIDALARRYQSAKPFPHIVLDNLVDPASIEQAIAEFPHLDGGEWISYLHVNERKFGQTDPESWGPTLQAILAELNSPRFVALLEKLTGIDDLFADESLEGGGLHQSTTGGFLNIHADFTVHPQHADWQRRVNALLYFNHDWLPEFGGDLELWSTDMMRCEETVAPLANRLVVFTTSPDSFHGHPEPMRCPQGMARKSMALYYFSREANPLVRSTEYRARPGDGPKAALIYLDKQALRAYDRVKRRLGLSDDFASSMLAKVERFRHKRPQS
jgi:hypothetical protein